MQKYKYTLDRRQLLSGLLISLAVTPTIFSGRAAVGNVGRDPDGWLPAALADTIWDWPAACRVGRAYVAAHPEEADCARLIDELTCARKVKTIRDLRIRIAEKRVRDFADQNIVVIEGWVLARVEARFFALISLL